MIVMPMYDKSAFVVRLACPVVNIQLGELETGDMELPNYLHIPVHNSHTKA